MLQADAVQALLNEYLPQGLMPNRPLAQVKYAQAAINNRAIAGLQCAPHNAPRIQVISSEWAELFELGHRPCPLLSV